MAQGSEVDADVEGVAKCPGIHCVTFFTVAAQHSGDVVVLLVVARRLFLWVSSTMRNDF